MIARLCAEHGFDVGDFSPESAAHRLGRTSVDHWFSGLATAEQLDNSQVFELHKRIMNVFADLGEGQARALASKYLHFHFPELFYLYDSRVDAAAAALNQGDCGYLARTEHDPAYGRYFACCRRLTDRLTPLVGRRLSPRELDRVLRAWLDRKEYGALDLPRPAVFTTLRV